MRQSEGVGGESTQPQLLDHAEAQAVEAGCNIMRPLRLRRNPAPRISQTSRGGSSRTPAQLARAKSAQTRRDRRLNKLKAESQDDSILQITSAPPAEADEAARELAAPVTEDVVQGRQTTLHAPASFSSYSHFNQSPATTFAAVHKPGHAVWRRDQQIMAPKPVRVIRPTPVRLAQVQAADQAPDRGITLIPNFDEIRRAMAANRLRPPVMQHSARVAYSGIRTSHMVEFVFMAQTPSTVGTGATGSTAHPITVPDLEDDIE